MCKYCELMYVNDYNGEKSNNIKNINRIREGHHVLDLNLFRYQDGDGCNTNELILEELIELHNGVYTVKEEHIEIKYCPFCGEKL